ncbi:MAG: AI-2E family transporter [Dethiosulfovibrio sp.]|nr:AI-2E family transporter [Dethiosulfovibrio sp.]
MGNRLYRDEEQRRSLERRSFLLALLFATFLFLRLLKPFFGALFWAGAIGIVFAPVYHFFLGKKKTRPNLAALASLGLCIFICVVPMLFILVSFLKEGDSLYQSLLSGDLDPASYIDRIKQGFPLVQEAIDNLNLDMSTIKEKLSGFLFATSRFIAQNAVQIGQNAVQFVMDLGLTLYMAFFMLRDGSKLVDLTVKALPMGDERERLLLSKFGEVIRATIKGNLLVATVQGFLGGVIFWFLGIHGAFFWGVVMAMMSLIPVVGAGLIWGPVAIYLFAVGSWGQGLTLTLFGIGVIGLVDNLLRPLLVGRDTKLPDYVVLLSTLGGFALFGMNGFVIGPSIAALFVSFWGIFMRDFNP